MSVSQAERNDRGRLRSGSGMESDVVSLRIAGALAGVRGLRNRGELQVPAGRAAPALVSAGWRRYGFLEFGIPAAAVLLLFPLGE